VVQARKNLAYSFTVRVSDLVGVPMMLMPPFKHLRPFRTETCAPTGCKFAFLGCFDAFCKGGITDCRSVAEQARCRSSYHEKLTRRRGPLH
jgi:hypothetical protein